MKKRINLLGLLFFLFLIGIKAQTPYFYYYQDEKQYLELDTKHIFISATNEKTVDIFASKNVQHLLGVDIPEKVRYESDYRRFWTILSVEDNLSDRTYLEKLSEIKNMERDIIAAPYFKNQYQDKIGLSNFFYVKLKELSDTTLLKQEVEKENAVIVYQNQFMPLWFVASVTENSKNNAMELANSFYESGLFRYAEPDLMVDCKINCVNDPHFLDQWGLNNTGQNGGTNEIDIKSCEAWQISTGRNVTVAVLDHGIDTHPDLNVNPLSYDS